MSRKTPATGAESAYDATGLHPAPAPGAELAELLRGVLLSVRSSPAATVQPLTEDALDAIDQFRAIDAALAVATVFTSDR
jgi:hypothetical protein